MRHLPKEKPLLNKVIVTKTGVKLVFPEATTKEEEMLQNLHYNNFIDILADAVQKNADILNEL